MEISPNRLGKVDSPLVSFIGDAVQVEGVVTLSRRMGQYPCQSIAQVDFLIIWEPLVYNAIPE